MGKLPIEKYLKWGLSASKNLTIDQVLKILLDLRYTGDWKKALQHIPNRKLKGSRKVKLHNKCMHKLQYLHLRKRIQKS